MSTLPAALANARSTRQRLAVSTPRDNVKIETQAAGACKRQSTPPLIDYNNMLKGAPLPKGKSVDGIAKAINMNV